MAIDFAHLLHTLNTIGGGMQSDSPGAGASLMGDPFNYGGSQQQQSPFNSAILQSLMAGGLPQQQQANQSQVAAPQLHPILQQANPNNAAPLAGQVGPTLAPQPQVDDGGDIPVQGTQRLAPQKLPGGFMAAGHTGANILGALADAFLVQGGAKPMYAPHVQQLKEAQALQNFDTNRPEALNRWAQLVPGADSLAARNQLDETGIKQGTLGVQQGQLGVSQANSASDLQTELQNRELKSRSVVQGMIGAAFNSKDSRAKAALLQKARQYAIDAHLHEVVPSDDNEALAWAQGIPMDEQMKNAANASWRGQQIDLKRQGLGIQQQNADTAAGTAATNKQYKGKRLDQIDQTISNSTKKTNKYVNSPETSQQIISRFAKQVEAGHPLTPNQQKVLDMIHPPKSGGLGTGKLVKGADGIYRKQP